MLNQCYIRKNKKIIKLFFDKLAFYMGFFDEIKSNIREMYSEFSQVVIWRERQFNCVLTQGQSSATLEVGGFVSECHLCI